MNKGIINFTLCQLASSHHHSCSHLFLHTGNDE